MPQTAETDLSKIKTWIKDKIKREGLTWGESKEEEIGYGIKKLVFGCVI
jgi:translation elongation factor EF-1beta